ncbi:MAG: alpha/beta fold hydrolase [Gammaproteobacteria bacterium]
MKAFRQAELDGAMPPGVDADGSANAESKHSKMYKTAEGRKAILDWYDDVVAKIDTDLASEYVETRFGSTHMLVAGPVDGTPLFLVPGIAGCAPLWRRQLPEFAKHFRVYALDIVGQPGKSDPVTPSFLGNDFSTWMVDVLDGLGIDKAHFAGTSVGGWMVLKLGIHAPERIEKIVMLSPTGVSRAKLPIKIWVTKFLNKRKDANALQDDLTAKSVTNRSPGRSFGTFDRQLAKLMALCTRHYRVDRSMGIYDERTRKVDFFKGMQVLRKFFLSEPKKVLRQFNVPALLVFGEHEMLYDPNKVSKRARKIMPELNTDIIEGAGHAAIYDKPKEVNAVVVNYLLTGAVRG